MGESKVQQIKKKMLQERFDKLEQEYIALSNQLNYTENAADQEKLKRQIQDKENEMKEVENQLHSLTQSEVTPHPLLQILKPYVDSAITSIQRAYQACCPQGFTQHPNTVEGILETLQDIPSNNTQFTPIERFVTHLAVDVNIPQPLSQQLQKWGEDNIKNFPTLIQDIKSASNSINNNGNSYLLIRLNPSNKKLSRFYIQAWLISDICSYRPETSEGCRQLYVSKSSNKTFTLEDMPQVVESLLAQSSSDFLRNLTLEFFLPSELLDRTVDCVIREEFGIKESIGRKYRVIVRANERLNKSYPYKTLWLEKWQKIKQTYNSQCKQGFVSGNHSLNDLRKELDKAIGLILTKFSETNCNKTIFSFLLITATPIALFLRKELENQDIENYSRDSQSAINSFLDCSILELPEKVREKRLDAPQNQDDHIGHHLSLIWEDPERLTPDAGYFYSLPQSVS